MPIMRYLTIGILVGMISVLVLGCAGRKHVSVPTEPDKPKAPGVNPTSLQDKFTFSDYTFEVPLAAGRSWSAEVKSGKAVRVGEKQVLTLIGVVCHLREQGKEKLTVNADKATAVLIGKTLRTEMSGHVLATELTHQQRLQAVTMRWTSTENRMHAQYFYWAGQGVDLSADQGSFSTDLTEATFRGHVRMATVGPPAPH
ncbi:MAG TPA: hypothetical protein VGL77_10455 [Armatimonadota bacterium]